MEIPSEILRSAPDIYMPFLMNRSTWNTFRELALKQQPWHNTRYVHSTERNKIKSIPNHHDVAIITIWFYCEYLWKSWVKAHNNSKQQLHIYIIIEVTYDTYMVWHCHDTVLVLQYVSGNCCNMISLPTF